MHSWGDQDYPCLSLPAIPETRTETDEEWQTRNLQYFTDSNAATRRLGLVYTGTNDRSNTDFYGTCDASSEPDSQGSIAGGGVIGGS